jgi:hypothetical protein
LQDTIKLAISKHLIWYKMNLNNFKKQWMMRRFWKSCHCLALAPFKVNRGLGKESCNSGGKAGVALSNGYGKVGSGK